MARQSIVGEKSVAFAKRVAKCYRYILEKKKESVASYQFYKSGTSIGANVREGLFAQSRKDFISKMNIAPNFRKYPLQPPADASRPRRGDAC